jgi:thiol-disulfide isomerase/thioredoxin/protocatechuate 3,4-dioxygenase beta subunit
MNSRLSRRDTAGLLVGTIILALSSLQWNSRANAEETNGETKPEVAAAPDELTMEVLVTDESGKPLPGAKAHASIWKMPGGRDFPNRTYTTDEQGVARVAIPERLQILRLWPSMPGYVPEFLNFAEGTHDEGKHIPKRYHFKLAKGRRLSGTVIDEAGKPIVGVEVEVRVEVQEPAWTRDPEPMICTSLTSFNNDVAVTDLGGRWSIDNAPAKAGDKDYEFRLKLTHGDYVRDSEWGELQSDQGVTTAMLRDGTARIVLKRGIPITGTVVDEAGKPIQYGLVIWNDDPYFAQGVNETQIGIDGRFETIRLPPGEYPITVVAPGCAPDRKMVTVNEDLAPLEFKLAAGKRLVMKFLDHKSVPVAGVRVSIDSWRGVQSLYTHKHSNVPDSLIPTTADDKGMYVWDWAPKDPVTYRIYASSDYASITVALAPRDEPHVVELAPRLRFSGTVTDASTGKPVPEFRIIPMTVFRPNFFSTSFQDAILGKNGQYELPIDSHDNDYRYQMRVEAKGYRSAMGESSYGVTAGAVVQDFALEPAPEREGIVVGPDGKPIPEASIVVGTPSIVPHMNDGELAWEGSGERIKTSEDGKFSLNATWEPMLIRATHKSGFAEVHREPDEPIGTLHLQPWARLSGRLFQDGQPVAKQDIFFSFPLQNRLGIPRFQDSFQTETDAEGRFEFERVPPIVASVRASLGPWQDSPLSSSQSMPLDLKSGEHRTVELGGNGTSITGKVVATGRDDVPLDKNWSLNWLVSRERSVPLPERFPDLSFDPNGAIQPSWLLDIADFETWLATRENYFVKLSPDGDLRISGVPAGKYDLVLKLYEQPAGCLVQTVGEKIVPVEVTESDVAAGSKSLGEIEVPCRVGPRVGEDMRAYKFVDAQGQERFVDDLAGKCLLVHVWASWCAPCLEVMPDIQATVERLADKPIVFVGLNVEADGNQAKAMTKRNGWQWAQNFLGDDSAMAKQLAISSVPAYYLIGSDGKLVASATEWNEIKVRVEEALNAGLP